MDYQDLDDALAPAAPWMDEAPPIGAPAEARKRFKMSRFEWRDPRTIPPRRWLYGRHYVRGYVTATVSPGGIGKSTLALKESAAMVSGRALLGAKVRRPLRVWYINLEDPLEEIDRRIAAICDQCELGADDLAGLWRDSGREGEIVLAEKQGDHVRLNHDLITEIEDEIRANGIDLTIVDPFVSSHRVPENDNGAIDLVVKAWAGIAGGTNSGVELIHHTRKPGNGQGGDLTVDDARGAGSLIGAVRSARVLNPMSIEDARKAGVPVEQRRSYFRVDDGKSNMQPPMEKATWRQLVSVDLGNETTEEPSDRVGVAIEWHMPGALDRVTVDHMNEVRRIAGSRECRAQVQSPDWIGHVIGQVVGIETDDESGRRQVKDILKPWLRSGALKIERRKDASRRDREFVVPGEFNEGGAPV